MMIGKDKEMMRNRFSICVLAGLACLYVAVPSPVRAAEDGTPFAAYYTRLPIENDDPILKVGHFADVVVRLDGELYFVFARDSSYLPCLVHGGKRTYVDEIISRKGDGNAKRPDRFNRYSHVRVIENTPAQVVVQWRYMADFANVEWDGVVDEIYTIRPNGEVERVVRKGTKSRRDWDDPGNRHVQTLRLTAGGIELVKDRKPVLSGTDPGKIEGNAVAAGLEPAPALWFAFDDALKSAGDVTKEARTKTACGIGGHKAVWKSGVSGTALFFDGYYSRVDLPRKHAPAPREGLTVQAWVALGAYPFNWGPIVHQSEWEKAGYYLGVNALGQLGFMALIGGQWQTMQVSTDTFDTDLPLFQWHHVAATYDGKVMRIYMDGKEAATKAVAGTIKVAERDLTIGLNSDKMRPTSAIRTWGTWPTIFGIDGLIDEVAVHDRALAPAEIAACRNRIQLGAKSLAAPDLEPRGLPADPRVYKPDGFGARYCNLKFHEGFDNMWRVCDYPDVVVDFDNSPCRVVFWRGLRYSPALVTENGKWSGDQSAETTDISRQDMPFDCPQAVGCSEHMSDAQTRYSHVRIIENTPARVVVHWRYAEVDVRYVLAKKGEDGWGAWADEYYSFYPDGVVIRHVARATGRWQETMFYNAPGTKPEDNVEMEAHTLINFQGREAASSWAKGYPPRVSGGFTKGAPFVTMVNLKSKWRPYYIYPTGWTTIFGCEVRPEFSRFPWWNHYPVSQAMTDGRSAERPDRMTHSSLVWGRPLLDSLMIGLTDKKAVELLPLMNSWGTAPSLKVVSGGKPGDYGRPMGYWPIIPDAEKNRNKRTGENMYGYRLQRRDYPLTATGGPIELKLAGNKGTHIHNLCFTVLHWGHTGDAVIEVDGKPVKNPRQGTFVDTDGTRSLVVFFELERTQPTTVTIRGAKPEQAVVRPVPTFDGR